MFRLVGLIALGSTLIIGHYFIINKYPITNGVANITLIIGTINFGLVARTGYLSEQIMHSEVETITLAKEGIEEDDD